MHCIKIVVILKNQLVDNKTGIFVNIKINHFHNIQKIQQISKVGPF